jgi:hypothetical protein
MNFSKRSNKVQSFMEDILVATGNQALTTGDGSRNLASTGNAANIASGQLGVLSADPTGSETTGKFITAGRTALQVKAVKVLQGTPKSSDLRSVSVFGDGDPAMVQSDVIEADKVISVTTTKFNPGTRQMQLLTGFSTPEANTAYKAGVTIQSAKNDIEYSQHKRNTVTTSYVTPLSAVNMLDAYLQNVGIGLNLQSVYGKGVNPFIVLGVNLTGGTGAADIGSLTAGTSVPFFTHAGVTYSYTLTTTDINSLTAAIGDTAALSTAEFRTLGAVTPGSAATVDALLVLSLDDPFARAFDDSTTIRTRVEFYGDLLRSTDKLVSKPQETVNGGRGWKIRYDRRAALQGMTQQYKDLGNFIIKPASYVVEEQPYTATMIEYYGVNQNMQVDQRVLKQAVILLPCAISNPNATAATGYTIATTATTTVTELNASLGAWLASASDNFSNVQYTGEATKAAPFV